MKKKKLANGNVNSFRSTSELSNPRWMRVGKVKELFFYPLKSGRGKAITDCEFTEFGISVVNGEQFNLRDR